MKVRKPIITSAGESESDTFQIELKVYDEKVKVIQHRIKKCMMRKWKWYQIELKVYDVWICAKCDRLMLQKGLLAGFVIKSGAIIIIIMVNHDHHFLHHDCHYCGQSRPSSLLLVSIGSQSHRPLPDNQSQLYLLNHHVLLPHTYYPCHHLVLISQYDSHILISPSSHPCHQSPILS